VNGEGSLDLVKGGSKVMHGEAAPQACDEQLSDITYSPTTGHQALPKPAAQAANLNSLGKSYVFCEFAPLSKELEHDLTIFETARNPQKGPTEGNSVYFRLPIPLFEKSSDDSLINHPIKAAAPPGGAPSSSPHATQVRSG
jgi:hypothetical protein